MRFRRGEGFESVDDMPVYRGLWEFRLVVMCNRLGVVLYDCSFGRLLFLEIILVLFCAGFVRRANAGCPPHMCEPKMKGSRAFAE
jgi:hypothetical protein